MTEEQQEKTLAELSLEHEKRLIAPHTLSERQGLYIKIPFGHYLETKYHVYVPGAHDRPLRDKYTSVWAGPCPMWKRGSCEFQGYMHGIYGGGLLLKCFVCDTVRMAYIPITLEQWQATAEQVLVDAQAEHDRLVALAAAAKKDGSKEIPI